MAVIQVDSTFSLAFKCHNVAEACYATFSTPFLLAGQRRSQGARLIEPGMPCKQSIISLPCPRFSHEVGDATSIAATERPEGLRGRGTQRKLHASG